MLWSAGMDVLSDILDTLRFRSSLYFTTDFRKPWGVTVPAYSNVARFHLVVSGECWVRLAATGEATRLRSGDLVMIPHGASHVLADTPRREGVAVDDILLQHGVDGDGRLRYGGDDDRSSARLVCGHFEFEDASHLFVNALPASIVARREEAPGLTSIDLLLQLVAGEADAAREGSRFVLKRLAEVLFIQVLRHWHQHDGTSEGGLLSAIRDRHVGRCLKAVHAATDQGWTVEAMAREAGLSRTAFAERFRRLVGQAPMHYLTQWRIQRARLLLQESDLSIERIAAAVGYQSPAAFARAFRKITGQSPGSIRRGAGPAALR